MQVETILGVFQLDSEGWHNPDTYDLLQCLGQWKININRIDEARKITESVGVMLHSMYHEEVFNEVSLNKIQAAANMAIRHLLNNIG